MPCQPRSAFNAEGSALLLDANAARRRALWFEGANRPGPERKARSLIFTAGCWVLWSTRNARRHQSSPGTFAGILFNIRNLVLDFNRLCRDTAIGPSIMALRPQLPCTSNDLSAKGSWVKWKPPMLGNKLNTDGSCCMGSMRGGGVIRDHKGSVVAAFSASFGNGDSLQAEALAMLTGLSLCDQRNISIKEVETDSLTIYKALSDQGPIPWTIEYSIRRCKRLMNNQMSVLHTWREGTSTPEDDWIS